MSDFRRTTDEFKVKGNQLLDKVRQIIDEGNARRIILKTENRTLLEFPLTVGVGGVAAGILLSAPLVAVGAIAALVSDVEIVVERDSDRDGVAEESRSYRPSEFVRDAADKAQAAARDMAGKARTAAHDASSDFAQTTGTSTGSATGASTGSTTTAGGASFTSNAAPSDKTMGSQPHVSPESDASWSPSNEERGGESPTA